jgi:pimeloyl-ACP methyl ester carboxylesterase
MSQIVSNQRVAAGAELFSVDLCGAGEPVMLLPSLARGAQDFAALMATLASSGFRAIAVNPRGIAGSTGTLVGLTLHDLAADIASIIESLDATPAHIVGHAFANRIARCLATDRPELVKSVTLLGAGGLVAVQHEAIAALESTFTTKLSDADWLTAIRTSHFFAPTSNPMVWREGWWPSVAAAQLAMMRATPHEEWWAAGTAPLLVIQGLDDGLSVPANGRALREALGDRVQLVELANAGHALLPEQPEAIAKAIVEFLSRHPS